jgi:hypothetical protein
VCGCTGYGPTKFDEKTGLYDIRATVDKKDIAKRETKVDLKKYRFVWLLTRTPFYPQRTEFLAREALAHSGFKHVLNARELTDLVTTTPELSWVSSLGDPVTQRRLAEALGPIVGVSLSYDDAQVRLVAADIATGTTLLEVSYRSNFALSNDRFYPVFNELKKWADECNATKEST